MNITLKNEHMTATVTTKGAELIELKDVSGKSYIWCGDEKYWTGRNPVLFPIVGNLKDGKIRMDGQTYLMGRHGFARNSEFEVAEQGTDFVVFELKSNDETYKLYPRKFTLQVRHTLHEDGFTTAFKVINDDEQMMPFCIGAHTAFNCPLDADERFEDYEIIFDEEETLRNIVLSAQGCIIGEDDAYMMDHGKHLTLDYGVFAKLDTIIFKNLKSTGVRLAHRENGQGVHMEFKGFPMMAFWTKGQEKAPFICIEPWHGCAAFENESGEFADKEFCIKLGAKECKELAYTVRVVKK